MADSKSDLIFRCLRLMLQPVVRFCLRRSLRVQDALESLKIVFLQVAAEELGKEGKKPTISRLSMATGIHRRDVMRIHREGETKEGQTGFVTKVVGVWKGSEEYTTKAGEPRILGIEGDDSDFNLLVRQVSRDVHPASVLFELERVGVIERTPKGVRLTKLGFDVRSNPSEGFQLFAEDTAQLMMSIEENVFGEEDIPNLHMRALYDNVSLEDLPHLREWLLIQGSQFQSRVSDYIANFDLDINPRKNKTGGGFVFVNSFCRTAYPEVKIKRAKASGS